MIDLNPTSLGLKRLKGSFLNRTFFLMVYSTIPVTVVCTS